MPDGGTAQRLDPRAAGWALALAVLAGAAPLAPAFYELRHVSSEPGSCDQLDRTATNRTGPGRLAAR